MAVGFDAGCSAVDCDIDDAALAQAAARARTARVTVLVLGTRHDDDATRSGAWPPKVQIGATHVSTRV